MSTKINIAARDSAGWEDVHYRYKRDPLHVTRLNKHNGRLKLDNLDIIARQLHVSPDALSKALRKSLNVPIHDRIVQSSSVSRDALEHAIQQFIEKHVLCATCGYPELNEDGTRCQSCGAIHERLKSKKGKKRRTADTQVADPIADQKEESVEQQQLDVRISALLTRVYNARDAQVLTHHMAERLCSELWECTSETALECLTQEFSGLCSLATSASAICTPGDPTQSGETPGDKRSRTAN